MQRDDLRLPPHSIESEQSVLGGLLLDNGAIDRIGSLRPEHFFRDDHRRIFVAICALITAGTFLAASAMGVAGLVAPVDPLSWPAVPPLAVIGILVSALPAVITPPLPRPRIPSGLPREVVSA